MLDWTACEITVVDIALMCEDGAMCNNETGCICTSNVLELLRDVAIAVIMEVDVCYARMERIDSK